MTMCSIYTYRPLRHNPNSQYITYCLYQTMQYTKYTAFIINKPPHVFCSYLKSPYRPAEYRLHQIIKYCLNQTIVYYSTIKSLLMPNHCILLISNHCILLTCIADHCLLCLYDCKLYRPFTYILTERIIMLLL